jgi:hypothetical protein
MKEIPYSGFDPTSVRGATLTSHDMAVQSIHGLLSNLHYIAANTRFLNRLDWGKAYLEELEQLYLAMYPLYKLAPQEGDMTCDIIEGTLKSARSMLKSAETSGEVQPIFSELHKQFILTLQKWGIYFQIEIQETVEEDEDTSVEEEPQPKE